MNARDPRPLWLSPSVLGAPVALRPADGGGSGTVGAGAGGGDRLRGRGLEAAGGGGLPPPQDPVGPGGWGPEGSGPSDGPPRRGIRHYLPFIALGAGIIATERITLLTLSASRTGPELALASAAVLFSVVGGAVMLGGRAFYRAWSAQRAEDERERQAHRASRSPRDSG